MSESLFIEPGLQQVTVWARGVLMNKDARDIVVGLTEAAAKEGKHVQAWENYVDLPDRIYVPVRAYAKISTDPIESRYVYENDAPDVVVLVEETMVKGLAVLDGIKPGAVLVVNSRRSPEEVRGFLGDTSGLSALVTVDANSMSKALMTLSGAEGATDATGIGAGISAPIAGAVVKATGIVKIDNLANVVKNPDAMKRGYNECKIMKLEKTQPKKIKKITAQERLEQLPFAGTVPSPQVDNRGMVTGSWRTQRPILDAEQCTGCGICWIYCPDACVTRTDDGLVTFNLEFCKGCALCSSECPTNAVTMVPELDFKD
ncbi:MAG TPA: 2-oxoacid:acceptor oxidoreductase [Syntrophomonas sp.]|jgi:oxalate oxidoreductase subunit delta|nr:2-oxoacid:acceptor oxidoreductase [Syntrophomonas sp.]